MTQTTVIDSPRKNREVLHQRVLRRLTKVRDPQQWAPTKHRNTVRRLYDGPAGALLFLGSLASLHQPLLGRVLNGDDFDLRRFRNILDIGSGAGQILSHLLKRTDSDAQIVACDLSTQMLRRARTSMRAKPHLLGRRPLYVAGDITQLPFADDTFDCITCGYVLEHLPDPRPGLSELNRVLKPDGHLLLAATEDTLPGVLCGRMWKCRTFNRELLREACAQTGLVWTQQLWFSRVHKFLKMGGILVEARKVEAA